MAKLHVLLHVFLMVLSITYSTNATPSTFKKMMMRAAADKAQVADQLARERRNGDSRFEPRPKFRTALQMKTLNGKEGHLIEKRAYISDHSKIAKHEVDNELPIDMKKRWSSKKTGRFQHYSKPNVVKVPKKQTKPTYGKSSSSSTPKKQNQPSYRKSSSTSNSRFRMSDMISKITSMNKENSQEEEEAKVEEDNDKDEEINLLFQLLGIKNPKVPEPVSAEEEEPEEEEEDHQVNVKRYDPILFLGKEYHQSHADSMVRHLLEKRNIELAEQAEEKAEIVQPVEVQHQNALHDRDSGHSKRSTHIGSHLQQQRHHRRSVSGHQHAVNHGITSLLADDNIGRMPFALKHKRSSSGRRQLPVQRSPMMLGARKSLTRF